MVEKFWFGVLGIILVADQVIGMFTDITLDFVEGAIILGDGENPALIPLFIGIGLIIIGFYNKIKIK